MTSQTTLTCACGASVFVSVLFDNAHVRKIVFYDMETRRRIVTCPVCRASLIAQWVDNEVVAASR